MDSRQAWGFDRIHDTEGDGSVDHRSRRGRNDDMTPEQMARETLSRARRIETRLTQTMVAMGIHTDAQKPIFDAGSIGGEPRLTVPSRHCSLKEMIDSIPPAWHEPVRVFVGDDYLLTIDRLGNRSTQ